MDLHPFIDSIILTLFAICIIFRLLWRDRQHRRVIERAMRCLETLGVDQKNDNQDPMVDHHYHALRSTTIQADLDDWTYRYDISNGQHSVRGQNNTLICQVIARSQQEHPLARLNYPATFRYIARFNPKQMLSILDRLQAYELVMQIVQERLSTRSQSYKLITHALSGRITEDQMEKARSDGSTGDSTAQTRRRHRQDQSV